MTQLSFAALDYRNTKKHPKRERFFGEMDTVVPWATLLGLIGLHHPKAGNGRRPYPLEVMLGIHCLKQWKQLSDLGVEEALYDIQPSIRWTETWP
jgi:IS5 family transposase